VADHAGSHYEVSRDELGGFLENRVAELEEFEMDLLFSPQFTPTLVDQEAFSGLLDRELLPRDRWEDLVAALVARPTVARLVTEDGAEHPVTLAEVTIERFVSRLNLDAAIPEPLAGLLTSMPPAEDRDLLKALARRPYFHVEGHREILFRFLVTTTGGDEYALGDVLLLLELVETYRPSDAADLVSRIPHWLEVLENEVTAASQPKPFFCGKGAGTARWRSGPAAFGRSVHRPQATQHGVPSAAGRDSRRGLKAGAPGPQPCRPKALSMLAETSFSRLRSPPPTSAAHQP
jgi:hypothetical protein